MVVEFKPIVGYEGLYECGSDGTVYAVEKLVKTKGGSYRSVPRKKLSTTLRKGYPRVALSRDGCKKYVCVHTLVALSFIGKPTNANLQVNHIDSNPLNNCVSNLEWVTPQENTNHKLKSGRARYVTGERHGNCQHDDVIVNQALSLWQQGYTQSEVARNLNIPLSTINGWCRVKVENKGLV